MKILFLGTGAADWPLEKTAEYSEFRRNASALVDDVLLIDPGPGVLEAMKEFGKDISAVKYVINTHKHKDHFNEETLAAFLEREALFFEFAAGDNKQIGPYSISAFEANHSTAEKPVHYIISDGESNLFYGMDGAWLMYDEVAAIKEKTIDFAVLDATIGDVEGDYRIFEHNNLRMVTEMKATLAPYIKRFCISHMARTLHGSQAELVERMRVYCVEVAYDGLETEF